MGTRCGDIDPAIVPYIMRRENLSVKDVDSLMNKSSGLLGLSESTNDMREIEEEALAGSESHKLAFEVFCRRVKKYIGSFAAILGGLDALVFTGGIGENSPAVRARCTEGLDFMGIVLDEDENRSSSQVISTGPVKVLVIPTMEELSIARDAARILEQMQAAESEGNLMQELAILDEALKAEIVLRWAADQEQGPRELVEWLKAEKNVFLDFETMKHLMGIMGLTWKSGHLADQSRNTKGSR